MDPSPRSKPTRLLQSVGEGDAKAAEQLLPLVYDELHRRARQMMQEQRVGHTLQPTALLHEAFLRLVDLDGLQVDSRLHFLRIAAKAMRHVLADHARSRGRHKRGGGHKAVTLDEGAVGVSTEVDNLLAIEDALTRLAGVDAQLAQIVELRYFGGLEHKEVAAALGMSLRSVERGWRVARAWLADAMEAGDRER